MYSVLDHRAHTSFSDPGEFGHLLDVVPTDPTELSAVARNLIVHYRASGHELPIETRTDIDARWLSRILALDQERHGKPLAAERDPLRRVQGCCRDHTLFCVGVLRQHGIAARSRVGFAGYFAPGWHHDHVIVELWTGERWRRFDSELEGPVSSVADPMDMGSCEVEDPGFVSAAQAWEGFRTGRLDPETYGVDSSVPGFRGPRFLFDEVVYETAHRFGAETLLWDGFGRMGDIGEPVSEADAAWADEVTSLLLAADDGDLDAERRLLDLFRAGTDLRPDGWVIQGSPFGQPPIRVAV